jgi:hypothetical protein
MMKGKNIKSYNTGLLTLLCFLYFYRQGMHTADGIPIISPSSAAIKAAPHPYDF